MADDHDRAGPVLEHVLEHAQRVEVEVVGRLVEQQHVGPGAQREHELQPAPLAARQQPDRRPLGVGVEPEPLQEAGVLPVRAGASVRPRPGRRASSGRGRCRAGANVAERDRRADLARALGRRAAVPAMTSSSVDLPAPLGPTMPSRSRGSSDRSTPRNSHGPSPKRWPTPCRSMTLSPSRARRTPRSSSPSRAAASGRPSTIAVAASMRALGLLVRAGAPAPQPGQLGAGQVAADPLLAGRPAPPARRAPRGSRRSRRRGRSPGRGRARGSGSSPGRARGGRG